MVGIDILSPNGLIIDLDTGTASITAREGINFPIQINTKESRTVSVIKLAQNFVVGPGKYAKLSIQSSKHLPEDRDLLIEPYAINNVSVYAHIVDCTMSEIRIHNPTFKSIEIQKNTRLVVVSELEFDGYFIADSSIETFAARTPKHGWKSFSKFIPMAFNIGVHTINNNEKLTNFSKTPDLLTKKVKLRNAITVYKQNQNILRSFMEVISRLPNLWKDTGNVIGIEKDMEIPFIENWNYK